MHDLEAVRMLVDDGCRAFADEVTWRSPEAAEMTAAHMFRMAEREGLDNIRRALALIDADTTEKDGL